MVNTVCIKIYDKFYVTISRKQAPKGVLNISCSERIHQTHRKGSAPEVFSRKSFKIKIIIIIVELLSLFFFLHSWIIYSEASSVVDIRL